MDEFFRETIEEIGEPQRPVPLGEEPARRLSGHLPGSFMNFIETYGFGDYFDRRLQYCDPEEFRSILALVFGADPDFSHRDCHVVAYSAFGRLVCWSERHDSFEVDLVDLRISSSKLAPTAFVPPPGLPRRERSTDPNILARTLLPSEKEDYEEYDNGGEPLFARCRSRHGPLERGECYGFFPASALVGFDPTQLRVETIRRVRALEHFAILAQLGTFHLIRLERGQYIKVRPIG